MFLSKKLINYINLFLLSPAFFSFAIYGMDTNDENILSPLSTVNLVKAKKILQKKHLPTKVVGSTLHISPTKKQIIIGAEGTVYELPLIAKPSPAVNPLITLFTHPKIKCAPMLTLALREKKGLIIASAGSFFSSDDNQWHASIIVYTAKKKSQKQRTLNHRVQTIQLNRTGNLLVIGGESSVSLFDIKQDSLKSIVFSPAYLKPSFFPLEEITICPESKFIIATDTQGHIQLTQIVNNNTLNDSKNVTFGGRLNIQKIHCPNDKEIIISSTNHAVQSLTIKDVENFEQDRIIATALATLSQPSGTLEAPVLRCTQIIDPKSYEHVTINEEKEVTLNIEYEKVVLNTGKKIASAHWTAKNEASEEARHTIKVSYFKNGQHKEYTLKAPVTSTTYQKQTRTGKIKSRNERFFYVTFYGRYIVALNSCGKIFTWKLPKDNTIENITTTTTSTNDAKEQTTRKRRSSSFIYPSNQHISLKTSSSDVSEENDKTASVTATSSTGRCASSPKLDTSNLGQKQQKISPAESPRNRNNNKRVTRKTPAISLISSSPSSHSQSPRKEDDKQ